MHHLKVLVDQIMYLNNINFHKLITKFRYFYLFGQT